MASRCEAVPGKALVSIPAEAKGQVELELLPVPRLIIPSGAWQTTSEAMTSTSVSDMAFTTTGEKIFSSPRTICRSVYPDRYQRTSAHQEPPVHLREEAYSPLRFTMPASAAPLQDPMGYSPACSNPGHLHSTPVIVAAGIRIAVAQITVLIATRRLTPL
ncbi:hypothetical protein DL98DRAFT_597782 [Cadophora sp. DSE1049]|nr:hypothetical protein DL98DRAFT_597782 [Cadophora sp. DSE1049]